MAYFSITACVILNALNTLLSKKFQTSFDASFMNLVKYNLINALVACLFLSAMNGFVIKLNGETLHYALVYALVVICSLVLSLFAYKFVSVALVSVISTSGNVALSLLFSILYLGETPSYQAIISTVLLIIATVIPLIGKRENFSKATVPICIAYFCISGASSIVVKLFTLSPTVTDSPSLFVATNIIIAILALFTLVGVWIKTKDIRPILKPFTLKQNANIVLRTALSNVTSVLSVFAISLMSLPIYSVTTSSFALVSAFLLSLFIFKEKTDIAKTLSVIIAVCAVILTLF